MNFNNHHGFFIISSRCNFISSIYLFTTLSLFPICFQNNRIKISTCKALLTIKNVRFIIYPLDGSSLTVPRISMSPGTYTSVRWNTFLFGKTTWVMAKAEMFRKFKLKPDM